MFHWESTFVADPVEHKSSFLNESEAALHANGAKSELGEGL